MRGGAVKGLSSLGDQGIKKGFIESWGAKMLDEEYGEEDQGTVGTVLVSHSFALFAVLFVCWLIYIYILNRNNLKSSIGAMRTPSCLMIWRARCTISPSRCSGRRLQRRSQEMVVGPGGCLPKRSRRMNGSDEWCVAVDVLYFDLYIFYSRMR